MKRIIAAFCLVFILFLWGCAEKTSSGEEGVRTSETTVTEPSTKPFSLPEQPLDSSEIPAFVSENAVALVLNGSRLDDLRNILQLEPSSENDYGPDEYHVAEVPEIEMSFVSSSGKVFRITATAEILLPEFVGLPVENFASTMSEYLAIYDLPDLGVRYDISPGVVDYSGLPWPNWPNGENILMADYDVSIWIPM